MSSFSQTLPTYVHHVQNILWNWRKVIMPVPLTLHECSSTSSSSSSSSSNKYTGPRGFRGSIFSDIISHSPSLLWEGVGYRRGNWKKGWSFDCDVVPRLIIYCLLLLNTTPSWLWTKRVEVFLTPFSGTQTPSREKRGHPGNHSYHRSLLTVIIIIIIIINNISVVATVVYRKRERERRRGDTALLNTPSADNRSRATNNRKQKETFNFPNHVHHSPVDQRAFDHRYVSHVRDR